MEDSQEMIAYCGLYCGECPSHTGTIPDLARDLRKELRTYRYEKTAAVLAEMPFFSAFKEYDTCYEVLGALVKMRCGKACRQGGGNPYCAIRKCATRRGFEGCWLCDEFAECEKLSFLEGNHGVAHIKNLRAIRRSGVEAFLQGRKRWYEKPKERG
jgi:hypothetical protein